MPRIPAVILTAAAAAVLTATSASAKTEQGSGAGVAAPVGAPAPIVRTIVRTVEVPTPAGSVEPAQISLGVLAGLGLAGGGTLVARRRRQAA